MIKKEHVKIELKSAITTFVAWLVTESFWNLEVFTGDFSMEALKGLLNVVVRALIKTMIVISLPRLKSLLNANGEAVFPSSDKN